MKSFSPPSNYPVFLLGLKQFKSASIVLDTVYGLEFILNIATQSKIKRITYLFPLTSDQQKLY
jgi:hypothetical protein